VSDDSPTTGPLVSAEWLQANLDLFVEDDPSYRLLEVSIPTGEENPGHIPSASSLDWETDLRDSETFDVLSVEALEELLGSHGITPETTIVLYGNFFNWFAAHAYWIFRYYGHTNLALLDGGRKYWEQQGFPLAEQSPSVPEQSYEASSPDESIRVRRADVERALETETHIIDVRAPPEYRGDILAPPGWNEGVQRGGHIPGAVNVPCRCTLQPDRRFKSASELAEVYQEYGEDDSDVILYCRVGERAALTWFVMTELLGYSDVTYYYGSFVEWGNSVGLPVESASTASLR